MKKKVLTTALALVLSANICGSVSAAEAELRIGDNTVIVNGEEQTIEAPPVIINERTLVPLRFIAEMFGSNVNWDAETKTIYISNSSEKNAAKSVDAAAALSLWTDGAQAKEKLVSYMKTITDESSADYIPVENRIAVFDLDGTLFCETDPNYFDYMLLVHRVLEDENYKDKASDFEKETAQKIVTQNETGESFKGLETDHGKCIASSFAGMTLEEFNAYIQKFKQSDMPSYNGLKRGEGWYKPMLEIVNYLQANDFTVYIVSGTDRLIVRGIVDNSPLDIPMGHIIGSDETLVSNNQGDTDGLDYVFDENDKLVLGGDFVVKNLKMNKVSVIAQEIGVQPVLSFGNSTGDSSMAEYTTSSNPYKSLAFMLCCDDTERENGSVEKAEKMFSLCEQYGWVPVSMKNDWTTIYGDGVTKK
ncbi:MAG: haloacid dehalogenase-like hydrolase [Firmicutes bacterium]|nr:haloacid dehalogenase-like hydrolase [Bacillota bacterium]